jgi:hypothetical protein
MPIAKLPPKQVPKQIVIKLINTEKTGMKQPKVVPIPVPKKPHDDMPPELRKFYNSQADHAPASDWLVPKDTYYMPIKDPFLIPTTKNRIIGTKKTG